MELPDASTGISGTCSPMLQILPKTQEKKPEFYSATVSAMHHWSRGHSNLQTKITESQQRLNFIF